MFTQSAYKSGFITLLLCCCLVPFHSSKAEVVEQTLPNGLVATAEYHQGDNGAPAIMLLHGFLQTRESHTVARLYDTLVDDGYTVLSPTLSLGISYRKQSLACEAIHVHSMQTDVAEVNMWTRWLSKKSGGKITLIGHSMGSVHLVVYLNQYAHEHIQQAILISLSHFGTAPAANETEADGKRANQAYTKDPKKLDTYGLSYCKEYVTTPGNYLSYYDWQPSKLLATLKAIHTPITVILGSADTRMSKDWGKRLKQSNIKVVDIPGAGHFFDKEFEFDLHDAVESILAAH